MQDSEQSPQQAEPTQGGVDQVHLARRKAILRGLGKSAAVAGAAMPLTSLATNRLKLTKNDGKPYQCSVSGNLSVMMSAGTPIPIECTGKKPISFKSKDGQCTNNTNNRSASNWPAWPSYNGLAIVKTAKPGGTSYHPDALFSTVFGGGSSTKIGALCNNSSTSDEAHWVAALINANINATTFPHLPQEVISHYKNASGRNAAIAFYRLVNKV